MLKAVRAELGLPQPQFAIEVDINPVHLSKLENGHSYIGSESALRVICRFRSTFDRLGYSLEDLMRSGR